MKYTDRRFNDEITTVLGRVSTLVSERGYRVRNILGHQASASHRPAGGQIVLLASEEPSARSATITYQYAGPYFETQNGEDGHVFKRKREVPSLTVTFGSPDAGSRTYTLTADPDFRTHDWMARVRVRVKTFKHEHYLPPSGQARLHTILSAVVSYLDGSHNLSGGP